MGYGNVRSHIRRGQSRFSLKNDGYNINDTRYVYGWSDASFRGKVDLCPRCGEGRRTGENCSCGFLNEFAEKAKSAPRSVHGHLTSTDESVSLFDGKREAYVYVDDVKQKWVILNGVLWRYPEEVSY